MVAFDTESRTAWISEGFENLVKQVNDEPTAVHFDVLIVGSGYGGAVAAATLAGRSNGGDPVRIAVLERGKEYLPGSFATGLAELPSHVRRDGNRQGLFDVRLGPEVNTVIANGVGGGSLINAGVMETPEPTVFQSGWPDELSDLTSWERYYDSAAKMVGSRIEDAPNTIESHPDGLPLKYQALRNIAPADKFRPAEITVAMDDKINGSNVRLNKCIRCGDCATGCNFGAKESLDVGLLVTAHQSGTRIFSGGTVLHVSKDGPNWIVHAVFTDKNLRLRDGTVTPIRANKVIVAAGTLGSNEILARSHDGGLSVSEGMLGKRCSTNGDMLAADFDTNDVINNVSDQTSQPSLRHIGPTITGIIDLRNEKGVLIEELSVPASLRLAFSEVFSSVNTLHSLENIDWSSHSNSFPSDDDYAVAPQAIKRSAVYAVMGNDGAKGHVTFGDLPLDFINDGTAFIKWNADEPDIFSKGTAELSKMTKASGGQTIANPAWKLLPDELSFLTGGRRGPVTTVHPLGGLIMADSGANGVVDPIGRVYTSGVSNEVHDGLVVLDGSIVPTALGINPALTIAALALRSAERLAEDWQFSAASMPEYPAEPFERPIFRETDHAITPRPTEVEVIERLDGPIRFTPKDGQAGEYVVELTIQFEPKDVEDLNPGFQGDCTLVVSADTSNQLSQSEIRIFEKSDWDCLNREWDPPAYRERQLDAIAKFRAPLSGTLKVLEREKSWAVGRLWRAGRAWLFNRGLRDTYQAIFHRSPGPSGPGFLSRVKSGIAIASRAGEVRKLVYDLRIGTASSDAVIELQGDRISGVKRFTYSRRGNPWRQLMEVALKDFPGLDSSAPRVLQLDTAYLARIGVPLFRIKEQADSVSAISDLLGFFGYFVRLLFGIHIWSFRAPDERTPDEDIVFKPPAELRLSDGSTVPAQIKEGAVEPEPPDMAGSVEPVDGRVRITRYRNPSATKPPVVFFHGYSAGGTTFAHHAVNPNFASHMWENGRDVLIADLRTSPYFKDTTAIQPWSFDQIAKLDVPWVIDKALELTGADQVDVVAHCMGTIVVSKAILSSAIEPVGKIRRVAFTQVGPLVVFSPNNILRGYIMKYLIEWLPDDMLYQFRPEDPSLADDLWDRVVATLPYPEEEFDIENPVLPWKRTPWTQTRHRMDALYGRDFNLTRIPQGVLDNIDEHFGALNLRTVASTLHYARNDMMTDFRGRNELVSREYFEKTWKDIPTFSVHGADNGLSDVQTVDRMEKILHDSGIQYLKPLAIEGAGHQDCLIGDDRLTTFEHVRTFLDADLAENERVRSEVRVAYPPWIGPILTREPPDENTPEDQANIVRIGASPSHREPEGAVLLRVHVDGDRILRPDDQTDNWDEDYVNASMVAYTSENLFKKKWDAFELPGLGLMPLGVQNHPGNATLVMLIYDESPILVARFSELRYHKIVKEDNGERLVSFSRELGDKPPPDADPDVITLKEFKAMGRSLRDALVADQQSMRSRSYGEGGQLKHLGMQEVRRTMIDPKAATGVREVRDSRMLFGPEPDFGEAALARLVEQDINLFDGVVPDQEVTGDQTEEEDVARETRFMFGSCQYPAGLLDDSVAYRSYDALAQRIQGPEETAPRFTLLVGDQVYVDPTAGLFDPRDLDDRYRTPYENWLRAPAVRTALRSVPSYMLLDDHEIVDNWEPKAFRPPSEKEAFENAEESYEKFQHGLRATRTTFEFDGFSFFLLDTRRHRRRRQVGHLGQSELCDPLELEQLKNWLATHKDNGPKFIVSPSMFLPRHRRAVQRDTRVDPDNLSAIHSDGWDGYPGTMLSILKHIALNQIRHVVFLSGDEHRACFAVADIQDQDGEPVTQFASIHTSAMWAPYPFANGRAADTVDRETFDIINGSSQFSCSVSTDRPAPGDGSTYIHVRGQGSNWIVECEFADGTIRSILLN